MTGRKPARPSTVRLKGEAPPKRNDLGDQPIAFASPPCLMHELDPAYLGFEPEEPAPTKDKRTKDRQDR